MNKRIILAIASLLTLALRVSAEDKLTIKDFSISAGETKTMRIELENEETYAAFQFDLYLPEGFTVGEFSADKDRVPKGTELYMELQKDGSYRFIAAAMGQDDIQGTSGGIVTIEVTASKELESGNLMGYFKNVKLSKVGGKEGEKYAEMSFPITVLAPSTVTANSFERVYGEANPTFDYTAVGGILDGIPKISCEATATSPVGTYDIIIERGTETNYNVTYIKGTLTITKAPLRIKAGTYTRKQGEENPEFTLTYEGFKNNETEVVLTKKPTATTTATKESAVGDYTVTVSGAEAQNYEITYVDGVLTVTAVLKGDANSDGKMDEKDIVDIVNHTMGKPTSTGKFNEMAADMNEDGVVNAADIVLIANYILWK